MKEYGRFSTISIDKDNFENEFKQIEELEPRARGFALEKLLGSVFEKESIEHRLPYRPQGEQIDGWISHQGRFFLVEAKWIKDNVPASSIYEFRGKIDGKLVGTLGIFISMSGYSADCVETVRAGKMLNVLLFDRSDLEAIMQGATKFIDLLDMKIKTASATGVIYYPWSEMERVKELQPDEKIGILIAGEGPTGIAILKSLVSFVQQKYNLTNLSPLYYSPGGKHSLLNTFPVLVERFKETSLAAFIAVVDKDTNQIHAFRTMRRDIRRQFEEAGYDDVFHLAVADPSLESWLGIDTKLKRKELMVFLENYDWNQAIQDDSELLALIAFLKRKNISAIAD